MAPKEYPNIEFITSIELACRNLAKGEADNLRGEVIEELSKNRKPPESNLSKEEWKALKNLREDDTIVILPAVILSCTHGTETGDRRAQTETREYA